MVGDYQKFAVSSNITFIGVCTSMVATQKSMEAQVNTFKLKPFANMLDSGGATAAAYGIPRSAAFRLIVVDGEGKIAFNAARGWTWSNGPDAGKFIHHTQIDASLKKYPGILGISAVPDQLRMAAHLFDLQQFQLMEVELNAVLARNKTPEVQNFTKTLRDKVAEHRAKRLKQIADLTKIKPVQAYREAMSFVQAFPTAPERAKVNEFGQQVFKEAVVKKEFDAEQAFHRIMVPELRKVTTPVQYDQRIPPLLNGYLTTFGSTDFAAVAKNACEGLKEAVNTPK